MEYLLLLAWEMKLEMFFILWKNNESLEDTSLIELEIRLFELSLFNPSNVIIFFYFYF